MIRQAATKSRIEVERKFLPTRKLRHILHDIVDSCKIGGRAVTARPRFPQHLRFYGKGAVVIDDEYYDLGD